MKVNRKFVLIFCLSIVALTILFYSIKHFCFVEVYENYMFSNVEMFFVKEEISTEGEIINIVANNSVCDKKNIFKVGLTFKIDYLNKKYLDRLYQDFPLNGYKGAIDSIVDIQFYCNSIDTIIDLSREIYCYPSNIDIKPKSEILSKCFNSTTYTSLYDFKNKYNSNTISIDGDKDCQIWSLSREKNINKYIGYLYLKIKFNSGRQITDSLPVVNYIPADLHL